MSTIAFVLYPGITPLDLVGPLQVMTALAMLDPTHEVVVVAEDRSTVPTDTPLSVAPSHTFDQVPEPDILIVPGGAAPTMRACADERLLAYLRRAAPGARCVASVCTGSMVLGAAGLLAGRAATTHWVMVDHLAAFGAIPTRRRWVEDGPYLTAAGVSAGIDMALHLAERLTSPERARDIQFFIEYDPEPPQGALDWQHVPDGRAMAEVMIRVGLADSPALRDRLLAVGPGPGIRL